MILKSKQPPLPPNWEEPIAILGFGEEGQSTLRHLKHWGFSQIRVLDRSLAQETWQEKATLFTGTYYLMGLQGAKTAIRSPGFRPFIAEIQEFQEKGGLLTSQLEAVFEWVGRDRIIGVTGTLGKGTCCSLLSAMLTKGGVPHHLAGNIGVPPFDILENRDSKAWLLLELSSFQLSTLKQSPSRAIVLKTTSEHLDWHANQEEYWDHKAHLTRYQSQDDICVYFADAQGSAWIAAQSSARKVAFGKHDLVMLEEQRLVWKKRDFLLEVSEIKMKGAFNLENIAAAAIMALDMGVEKEVVLEAAKQFNPLEHRLEFVKTLGAVSYYNDSYATRPEAALAAVQALRGAPLGIILGGSEKHADFSELSKGLAAESHLHAIALIGITAKRLLQELEDAGVLFGRAYRRCENLEEAAEYLQSQIQSGAILLSPACASFGLFANYKERGKAFKKWVELQTTPS